LWCAYSSAIASGIKRRKPLPRFKLGQESDAPNVGYRTDPKVETRYICRMPSYSVKIYHGEYSSTGTVDLPDDDAARQEASAVCADLIRDIIPSLTAGREYRLEVAD
jgi:hypothetical protein